MNSNMRETAFDAASPIRTQQRSLDDERDRTPARCIRRDGCSLPGDCQSRGHCRLSDVE